jgi:hypothetical protein
MELSYAKETWTSGSCGPRDHRMVAFDWRSHRWSTTYVITSFHLLRVIMMSRYELLPSAGQLDTITSLLR